jgi:hypothetical protein
VGRPIADLGMVSQYAYMIVEDLDEAAVDLQDFLPAAA